MSRYHSMRTPPYSPQNATARHRLSQRPAPPPAVQPTHPSLPVLTQAIQLALSSILTSGLYKEDATHKSHSISYIYNYVANIIEQYEPPPPPTAASTLRSPLKTTKVNGSSSRYASPAVNRTMQFSDSQSNLVNQSTTSTQRPTSTKKTQRVVPRVSNAYTEPVADDEENLQVTSNPVSRPVSKQQSTRSNITSPIKTKSPVQPTRKNPLVPQQTLPNYNIQFKAPPRKKAAKQQLAAEAEPATEEPQPSYAYQRKYSDASQPPKGILHIRTSSTDSWVMEVYPHMSRLASPVNGHTPQPQEILSPSEELRKHQHRNSIFTYVTEDPATVLAQYEPQSTSSDGEGAIIVGEMYEGSRSRRTTHKGVLPVLQIADSQYAPASNERSVAVYFGAPATPAAVAESLAVDTVATATLDLPADEAVKPTPSPKGKRDFKLNRRDIAKQIIKNRVAIQESLDQVAQQEEQQQQLQQAVAEPQEEASEPQPASDEAEPHSSVDRPSGVPPSQPLTARRFPPSGHTTHRQVAEGLFDLSIDAAEAEFAQMSLVERQAVIEAMEGAVTARTRHKQVADEELHSAVETALPDTRPPTAAATHAIKRDPISRPKTAVRTSRPATANGAPTLSRQGSKLTDSRIR